MKNNHQSAIEEASSYGGDSSIFEDDFEENDNELINLTPLTLTEANQMNSSMQQCPVIGMM